MCDENLHYYIVNDAITKIKIFQEAFYSANSRGHKNKNVISVSFQNTNSWGHK